MIRRACALALLLALSSQTVASLYACHHHHGERSGTGGAGASLPAAVHATHGDGHDHDAAPRRGCNRHHRGACAHEARGSLSECGGDPTSGLRLASEVILQPPVAPIVPRVATERPAAGPAPAAAARSPSPELPPPRA